MALKATPLELLYLNGSLNETSLSPFERWKVHLEFEYDFVKVRLKLWLESR